MAGKVSGRWILLSGFRLFLLNILRLLWLIFSLKSLTELHYQMTLLFYLPLNLLYSLFTGRFTRGSDTLMLGCDLLKRNQIACRLKFTTALMTSLILLLE